MKQKIILDIDTGIDDALALAYAVRSNKLEIVGLTNCFGNVTLDTAVRNTKHVLKQLDQDIPVYPGSDHPLERLEFDLVTSKKIHGDDGLGNLINEAPHEHVVPDQATDFIIEKLNESPDEIILVFVGPLTNLAKIIKKDETAVRKAKKIVIMGGAVTVPGNVREHAEANIFSDPEAAKLVFESGVEVTLVGLDVTMQTLLPKTEIVKWYEEGDKLSNFFADISSHYVEAYESFKPDIGGCGLHDPLAIGVVLDPSFVRTEKMALTVDTADKVGETKPADTGVKSVNVCLKVDKDRFLEHFLTTLNF